MNFPRLADHLSLLAGTARRIVGMPDYPAYCAHLRSVHPERPLPTERQYFDEYLASRYGAGTSRCC